MKILLLLFVFIIATSCESKEYKEGNSTQIGLYSGIRYFKDVRTGLCFAEIGISSGYSFTCVPCSKEVEELIYE